MEKTGDIRITPIGVIHCGLHAPADAPKNYTESTATGMLEIFPPYLEAMAGVKDFTSVNMSWDNDFTAGKIERNQMLYSVDVSGYRRTRPVSILTLIYIPMFAYSVEGKTTQQFPKGAES